MTNDTDQAYDAFDDDCDRWCAEPILTDEIEESEAARALYDWGMGHGEIECNPYVINDMAEV